MRSKGSRNTLIRIDYDTIGRMAGVAGDTAKQYAHRGEYDPRNLENVLQWVNGRRARRGLPLVGVPSENGSAAEADSPVVSKPAPLQNGLLYYDPIRGCYRSDEMPGSMAFRR
ncbi:MAG: hypothetical protein ACK5YR_15695 [Pirellula sp.]|jgi:hypothetical protein